MLTSRNHKFAVSRKMFASFLLLLVTSAILSTIVAVMAQPTEISVINSETGDNNFVFYTNTTTVGTRFNGTVWLDNVTDLFAYQVHLTVNDTFLNITNAWLPTWNSSWVFDGITTMQVAPAFYDLDTDGVTEAVKIGDTILLGDRFNGSGLLAVIEFEMIYAPTTGSVSCNLDIDNADTYLLNYDLDEIPTAKTNGYYEYFYAMGTSVITISVFPANVTTYSNVTVSGNITPIRENVTVTVYYRNYSDPWAILATVSTNSSSGYYYVWQTTEPGIFGLYANWTGDLVTEGASSEIKVVTVEDDNTPPEIHDVYQQPTEDNVYPDDKVEVYANVTDDLSGVKQVILNYTTNNGTWFDQEMTNLSGNLYNATIPPYPYCTTVTYVVIAEDNFNNTITTEELEYDTQYHVIPEFPSTTVLLTIVLTTLAAVIIRKKRLSKKIPSNKLYLD
ncbi:hypothetical protein KAU55_03430 [Candidatus Bathyarchaeota archaeon]|nr:hypothetical protein [Candidatus Bathyarchaeota archaeon]